jgi:aconitate hydratase
MAARPASEIPDHWIRLEQVIGDRDVIAASVLSGNRNFEARVHQSIKANFLMSPPLVVAFALAGRIDIDITKDHSAPARTGKDVYLRDIWPSVQEINDLMRAAFDPETYRSFTATSPNRIRCGTTSLQHGERL